MKVNLAPQFGTKKRDDKEAQKRSLRKFIHPKENKPLTFNDFIRASNLKPGKIKKVTREIESKHPDYFEFRQHPKLLHSASPDSTYEIWDSENGPRGTVKKRVGQFVKELHDEIDERAKKLINNARPEYA